MKQNICFQTKRTILKQNNLKPLEELLKLKLKKKKSRKNKTKYI